MQGLRSVMNHYRYISGSNLLVGVFFVLGLMAFGVLGITQGTGVRADIVRNCDANAIMKCGAADANEFRTKYDQNASSDLPAVYGHYRIPRDLQVVQGQSYKDGTVRVNGRVVATNAQSIGREPISGSHAISIAGKTYYETPNSAALVADGLPTLVGLDAQGNFKYAIISSCGNPIYATPKPPTPTPPTPPTPKPVYTCDALTASDTGPTSKRFTVSATAKDGATISGYSFDFGDGSAQDSTQATIDHTYAKAGKYTVKATVKVQVNGKTVLVSGPKCTTGSTINMESAVACSALNVVQRAGADRTYDFTVHPAATNATYTGAVINYGDGSSDNITGTTASHQYAQVGNFTIVATLSFSSNGTVKQASCQAQITGAPCVTNGTISSTNPACQPPVTPAPPAAPTLPKTGAGSEILGGIGVASMIISASLYLGSRRDFLAAVMAQGN